jgi:hypothetical protein
MGESLDSKTMDEHTVDEEAPPPCDSRLAALLRNLGGAQANDSGWPLFDRKYVGYPRFRKE